jgi:outer membrane protein assembly factor BamD (BamD/ComL family)
MRRLLYSLAVLACLALMAGGALDDPTSGFKPDVKGLPRKKGPSILHRPAKATPAEQLEYSRSLLDVGRKKAAAKQFEALVHAWHGSSEAPSAQFALAGLLEERGKYRDAFDEFQYLIDNYAGSFPYEETLEHQFRIANHFMTAKQKRMFVFRGFTDPKTALSLFEQIVRNAPGWSKTPQAQFFVGVIHEDAGDEEEAISAYEITLSRFPDSRYAEQASFRRSRLLYRSAVKRPRDESGCRSALSALAGFLRDHPLSEHTAQARQHLDELRERLAAMYFAQAEFYDKTARRPQAALMAYREFLRQFPLSEMSARANERVAVLKFELEEKYAD